MDPTRTQRNDARKLRLRILREIDKTVQTCFGDCKFRHEMNSQRNRGNQTRVDQHCKKVCPVGKRLQVLGSQLNMMIGPREDIEILLDA